MEANDERSREHANSSGVSFSICLAGKVQNIQEKIFPRLGGLDSEGGKVENVFKKIPYRSKRPTKNGK